ncbi:MAG: hypothetical protein FJ299_13715, partial [Planctomycetes bacterium]|nr:hypothetical protein [Planctomycetota bacterium]
MRALERARRARRAARSARSARAAHARVRAAPGAPGRDGARGRRRGTRSPWSHRARISSPARSRTQEEARLSVVRRTLDPCARCSDNRAPRAARTPTLLPERILDRSAVLAVHGLGHVGLPLAAAFARAGYHVLGHDIDAARVAALARGEPVLPHLTPEQRSALRPGANFDLCGDRERLREASVHFLCVPTPLGLHREPDLSAVRAASAFVASLLRPEALVVLCSTTYPGTTREVV